MIERGREGGGREGGRRLLCISCPPQYEEVEHRLSTAEEEMEDHVTIETPSTIAENQDEESSL